MGTWSDAASRACFCRSASSLSRRRRRHPSVRLESPPGSAAWRALERPADVRRDPLGERPVPPEVAAVGVDHHHLRPVAERRRLAVAQPEIEGRPEHQDHVGLPEGEPARQLERHGVIVREAAAPHPVREHGQARALGEAGERVPCPVPVDAAPGHDRRALGGAEERRHAVDRVRRRGGAAACARSRERRVALVDRRHQEVDRDLDEDGAGLAGEGHVDRAREVLRDEARLGDGPGALGDGRQERHLVHLLEGAPALQAEGRSPADQEERAPRGVGVRHAGDRVGHAGARHHHGDAEATGEPRPRVRGVRRRLLVTDVDDADPVTEAGVVDREDVPAAEREDRGDALAGEDPRDQLAPGQVGHATGLAAAGRTTPGRAA